jgi:hypothetical protein
MQANSLSSGSESKSSDRREQAIAPVLVNEQTEGRLAPSHRVTFDLETAAPLPGNAALAATLSAEERQRLRQYELMIQQNMVEIGMALLDIQESRLYRETHESFEAYVHDRFGISKTHAYGKIAAARVIKNLSGVVHVLPQNERQCRPLTSFAPAQQQLIWQEVIATGDRITGKLVEKIVAKHKPPRKNAQLEAGEFKSTAGLDAITIDIDLEPDQMGDAASAISPTNNLTTQPANQLQFKHARADLQNLPPQAQRQVQIKQQQRLRKLMEEMFQRCTPAMSKLVQRKLELYFYQFVAEEHLGS